MLSMLLPINPETGANLRLPGLSGNADEGSETSQKQKDQVRGFHYAVVIFLALEKVWIFLL